MIEKEQRKVDSRTRVELFIKLKRENTVLPSEVDLSLGQSIGPISSRMFRHVHRENSKPLAQMAELLREAPISNYLREQLFFEFKLEILQPWDSWDEVAQRKVLRGLLGISLEEGEYGIFDPETALKAEANYFYHAKALLIDREERGLPTPVSHKEWAADLFARVKATTG